MVELDEIMAMHDIYGNSKISMDEFYTMFDNDDDNNIGKVIKQNVINPILKLKENAELSD